MMIGTFTPDIVMAVAVMVTLAASCAVLRKRAKTAGKRRSNGLSALGEAREPVGAADIIAPPPSS